MSYQIGFLRFWVVCRSYSSESTFFTIAIDLEFVPHRFKVILFSKFILEFLNILIHHLYEPTALKADKMVMMFSPVHLFVSGLTFTDLYLLCETCFKKEIEISMDSGISNRGVLFLYSVKKFINSYVAT